MSDEYLNAKLQVDLSDVTNAMSEADSMRQILDNKLDKTEKRAVDLKTEVSNLDRGIASFERRLMRMVKRGVRMGAGLMAGELISSLGGDTEGLSGILKSTLTTGLTTLAFTGGNVPAAALNATISFAMRLYGELKRTDKRLDALNEKFNKAAYEHKHQLEVDRRDKAIEEEKKAHEAWLAEINRRDAVTKQIAILQEQFGVTATTRN